MIRLRREGRPISPTRFHSPTHSFHPRGVFSVHFKSNTWYLAQGSHTRRFHVLCVCLCLATGWKRDKNGLASFSPASRLHSALRAGLDAGQRSAPPSPPCRHRRWLGALAASVFYFFLFGFLFLSPGQASGHAPRSLSRPEFPGGSRPGICHNYLPGWLEYRLGSALHMLQRTGDGGVGTYFPKVRVGSLDRVPAAPPDRDTDGKSHQIQV
ncbi:hypothetical protein B0T19DRAFT_291215 [Cercophora scortea]|uniref:Uncharacterized protein n=1 Tax=Cercophora scortea TaxID=314031 RepID=A0AAE0I4H9_9PEZI|nr:hypothetical protein B0T19DRAFT_291215 [Cercophora scortea]